MTQHRDTLLQLALEALTEDHDRGLAITHLSQAVLAASKRPGDNTFDIRLEAKVREIIDAGGDLDWRPAA